LSITAKGTAYDVSFPDFPGGVAGGDTIDAAALDAEAALVAALETIHEDEDEDVPEPSLLDAAAEFDDGTTRDVLVEARYAKLTVRA
jgi:predicted RNase H-like HicB family nuclease